MAGLEYSELQGNECILKAVEYLRMLPKWKEKPGTLRSGFVEYAELLARHLVKLYGDLEGKPISEVIELSETIDPIKAEKVAQVELQNVDGKVKEYDRALNEWHLELAMLRDLVNELLWQMEGEEWMKSAGHIAGNRFSHLVETCPFPKADHSAA